MVIGSESIVRVGVVRVVEVVVKVFVEKRQLKIK